MKVLLTLLLLTVFFIPLKLLGQEDLKDSTKPSEFIAYCNFNKDSVEKPIHLEWVQKDKDIIRNILNKLPAIGSSVTEIQKLLPNFLGARRCNCQSTTHNLDHGLTITRHTFYGGYGTYNVNVIYFRDHVIMLKLILNVYREIIIKHLYEIIQVPFECKNEEVSYTKTYQSNLNEYRKDSGDLFLESIDTNYRRRDAINYFSDILASESFSEPYYIPAELDKIFNDLRYFIVNKDYNALESILFSPSPTSRLFAAITLVYMKDNGGYKPPKKVDNRIKETIANAHIIRSGILSCHLNKFEYDYYNIVKDFESLLATQ